MITWWKLLKVQTKTIQELEKSRKDWVRWPAPINLVPRAFLLKYATHFLTEKPWGRGCAPIYMRVGYVFELRFSAGMI